jgi:ribosome-binding protein aMBF1 (putative translation factor)
MYVVPMSIQPRSPLDEVMTSRGLRNDWLAEQLDCDPADVSRWRAGTRIPIQARREQIARVLGLSEADDLVPEARRDVAA